MLEKLLSNLKKSSGTAGEVLAAQTALVSSRAYEFLREIGRAKDIHPATPNYLEVQAMQSAWSVGYNQCLDDIMLFRERFLEADLDQNPPKMSFGGLDLALFKDDLTKEEANAIRSGKSIPKLRTSSGKKRNTRSAASGEHSEKSR